MGTYIEVLGREDDNFIELGYVSQEIVDSGAFCGSPSVFALRNKLV